MAHKCPRCGQPVKRGFSRSAHITGGIVGSILYAAFGGFECIKCGRIERNEFSEEVRQKMTYVTWLLVAGAVAVAIGGLLLYAYI